MAGFGDPTPDLGDLNTRRSGTFPAAGRNFPRFRVSANGPVKHQERVPGTWPTCHADERSPLSRFRMGSARDAQGRLHDQRGPAIRPV